MNKGAVSLRPIDWRHFPFLWSLLGDAKVRAHLGGIVPMRQRPARIWHWIRQQPDSFIWVAHHGQSPVGIVFVDPARQHGLLELSFMFARDSWGKGLARAAVTQALALVPRDVQIIAETRAANARARDLLTAIGWVKTDDLTRFGVAQVVYRPPSPDPSATPAAVSSSHAG